MARRVDPGSRRADRLTEGERMPLEDDATRAGAEPYTEPVVDRRDVGRAGGTRETVEPRRRFAGGLTAGLGLLSVLAGAWGGIVAYIGPTFGYQSNGSGSWVWSWQHSLLHLIPGAVAVAAGLLMWAMAARTRGGSGRLGSGLAGLALLASGAWFVLGPVVWPIYHTSPVFGPASPTDNFVNQLGYNLGPGLVIVALGGLTLASAATRRRQV